MAGDLPALRQRYAVVQQQDMSDDDDHFGSDGETPVPRRTHKPLDDSWASIGKLCVCV